MEDKFLNGWTTRDLLVRLTMDDRCPKRLRDELSKELPAFDVARRSQPAQMAPARLPPISTLVMRAEVLIRGGVRESDTLSAQLQHVALFSNTPVSDDEVVAIAEILLTQKH